MTDRVWHLYTADGAQGPYAADEIRAWLAEGSITDEWSVWREGMADWAPIAGLGEFRPAAPAPPVAAPARPDLKPATPRLRRVASLESGPMPKKAGLSPGAQEALEWVGLAPADLPVYLATGLIAGMYFTKDPTADLALSVGAIVSTLASCAVGMRWKEKISAFTNVVKMISYPLCLAAAAFCVYLNYASWNLK